MCAPVATARPAPRAWGSPLAVGMLGAAGCVAVGLSSDGAAYLPGCPFRTLTGLDCPGCGMTRATRQLLHLHPAAAADFNLLLMLVLPLAAYAYVAWLARSLGRPVLPMPRLRARAGVVALVLVAVFAVVRNLPVGPLRYLNSAG